MSVDKQALLYKAIEFLQERNLPQAEELLKQLQVLDSQNPDVYRFLSVLYALERNFQKALELIDRAIFLAPQYGVAHSNRGNILKEMGRYSEALDALDKAIILAPSYAEAYSNRGNVLQDLERYEEAITWYDKAIALAPRYAEAHNNRGNSLFQLKRNVEAMESYDKATNLNPNYADCYFSKAVIQLSEGSFQSGWQNFEARFFQEQSGVELMFSSIPRLQDLENINAKKILIWAEQGLGDSIQFCRYIKKLASHGAEITFLFPSALLNIFISLREFSNLAINVEDIQKNLFDYQVPLLSLPLIFNTDLSSIPADIPYLSFDIEKKVAFEKRIGNSPNLKVGVIWNGGFRPNAPELWEINRRRNIELEQICKLRDVPGVDFFSLQKGDPAEAEFSTLKDKLWPNMINCAPWLNDFSDTAALMECLDLIISVDTSSAHLAGALGKPVWLLNRYIPCWRWLKGCDSSPWYPTAKIYQQSSRGAWGEVVERVKGDLINLAKTPRY